MLTVLFAWSAPTILLIFVWHPSVRFLLLNWKQSWHVQFHVDPRREKSSWPAVGSPPSSQPSFRGCFQLSLFPFQGTRPLRLWQRGPPHKPTGLGRSEQGQDNISLSDQNFLLQTNTLPLWTPEKIRVWIEREIVSLRNCDYPSGIHGWQETWFNSLKKFLLGEYWHTHPVSLCPVYNHVKICHSNTLILQLTLNGKHHFKREMVF